VRPCDGIIVANDTIDVLQNRITGENVVTIEFSEAVNDALLNKIKGIKTIKRLDNNRFQLLSDLKTDVRADVFRFAVERNLTLLEMKKEVFSVEDVFQELTK
jgi:ABC-2 type transport system ATP-binding protein